MVNLDSDVLKVIVPALSAIIGGLIVVGGQIFIKGWELRHQERQARSSTWLAQKQTHWSPLLAASHELGDRLKFLTRIYKNEPDTGFDHNSVSEDFRELYMLKRDPIGSLQDCDPNAPRRNQTDVQTIRSRVCHELTLAESSLYATAVYLGHAEHVMRDLRQDRLVLPDNERDELVQRLLDVRLSLQGPGAGIPREQQAYMGEAMWNAGGVMSNLEFRNRLFDMPGWETFKGLLRFYAEFAPKVPFEVAATITKLDELCDRIERLRQSRA
jgi:hypothetical protein